MNISTKAPQSLKWLAFSVTFAVFLLVNYTSHNLYADDSDENQRFIEIGTCHTPNFGTPHWGGLYIWEWANSIVEFLNQQHSLRHEEPYFAITAGRRLPNKMYLEWRQRGFFSINEFGDYSFLVHVAHYFVGRISYVGGWMRNETHLISAPEPGAILQERYCSPVIVHPETVANEAINEGNVPFDHDFYAHIRFLRYGWENRPYHLFLQNCQHWTDFVLTGLDTSGMKGPNLWGFGQALFYLPPWVVAAIWLL